MRYAILKNNVVVNIAESNVPFNDNWIESEIANMGWSYVDGVFFPPPVDIEAVKAKNKNIAKSLQDEVLSLLSKNTQKVALGLPPEIADEEEAKAFVISIQADIDNPPETEAYNPELPPGVNPPEFDSITITITREPGWNGVIGWRAVITAGEENFEPTNLAMAEYSNPDCDGYLYTTGAFQQDGDTWYAVCPPGQEKGNVDVHLSLLYGAALLSCFTFVAGNQEQIVTAYEA